MEDGNIYSFCHDWGSVGPNGENSAASGNSNSNSNSLRRFGCYAFAPGELFETAEEIVSRYHPHLKDTRIAYLFRAGKWHSKGKTVTGHALVAPPLWRCASGFELILVINEILYQSLDRQGKKALLDHELSRFSAEGGTGAVVFGDKTWSIKEHDIREFSDVVKRHGICFSNLRALAAGRQLQLVSLQSLQEKCAEDLSLDEGNKRGPNENSNARRLNEKNPGARGPNESGDSFFYDDAEENLFYEETD